MLCMLPAAGLVHAAEEPMLLKEIAWSKGHANAKPDESKLTKVEAQCVWAAGLVPADPDMVAEHLRAYVTLLSAHFQGFCRDLYTEASFKVVARIKKVGLRPIIQAQFAAGLKLDKMNPTLDALSEDFRRFGIADLRAAIGTGPPAEIHKGRLKAMNGCRNKCAHGEPAIPELLLANIQDWRNSCCFASVGTGTCLRGS